MDVSAEAEPGHCLIHIDDVPRESLENIDLAFVDLDSTCLNKKKVPSAGFWEALEHFEASGGRVIPATGNARAAAQVKLRNADATGWACPKDAGGASLYSSGADLARVPGIYQNGAEVRGCDGQEISATWLDKKVLERLVDWFYNLTDDQRLQVGIAFQSYGDVYILAGPSEQVEIPDGWKGVRQDQIRVAALEKWSRAPYHWGEGCAEALPFETLKEKLLSSNVHCAMLMTRVDAQSFWADKVLQALDEVGDLVNHCLALSDAPPLDRTAYVFTHPMASKGSGLELLLSHFGGIDAKRVVAFGDNANDKPMFLVPGVFGVAVDNAKDVLKIAACAVTRSNEEASVAGVAHALRRITQARAQSLRSENPRPGGSKLVPVEPMLAEVVLVKPAEPVETIDQVDC